MSDDLMTIREMCDQFGVTARTLRFYEQKELLSPVREGQKRLFTRSDRARLKLILRGKRFGFPLEEIRQWLLIYEQKGSREQHEVWLALADRQLKLLDEQIAELQCARADLKSLRDKTSDRVDGAS